MNNHFKRVIALLTLILTLAAFAACSAEDKVGDEASSFTPSDDMAKLVVVTNSFCFDADYGRITIFHLKLLIIYPMTKIIAKTC